MKTTASKVAHFLLKIKAVKLNPSEPFTWSSGIQSPIYCDNRQILSFVEVRNKVKHWLKEASEKFGPVDAVAGVATAGIPHGALLADMLAVPFIYVRSKAKGHGLNAKIEGHIEKGMKVLVIEDLISTGGSSLDAVQTLRENNLEVVGVLAIFSYQLELADKNFKQKNCKLETLSNFSTLVEVAKEEKLITEKEIQQLKLWQESPNNWTPA